MAPPTHWPVSMTKVKLGRLTALKIRIMCSPVLGWFWQPTVTPLAAAKSQISWKHSTSRFWMSSV